MCDNAGAPASRVSGLTSTLLTPAHRGPGREKTTHTTVDNQRGRKSRHAAQARLVRRAHDNTWPVFIPASGPATQRNMRLIRGFYCRENLLRPAGRHRRRTHRSGRFCVNSRRVRVCVCVCVRSVCLEIDVSLGREKIQSSRCVLNAAMVV